MRSLHENLSLATEENSDFNLINVTDEEIVDWASQLIRRLHKDNIRELDKQITSISGP